MSAQAADRYPEDDALEALPAEELSRLLAAGDEVRECLRVLSKVERNIVGECLREQGTFYEFDHYPEGDVYDQDTHAQYYYHAHRGVAGEHGHFHTFLRSAGMPEGMSPAPWPGGEPWPEGDDVLCHFVAVSMDRYGHPLGLFTTNRWVTGENWFAACDVIAMLDHFVIDHAHPSWPVNRWLSAMMILFRPTIEQLLHERDEALERWRVDHPGEDVFEDRDLEIMSTRRISIDAQVNAVRALLD